MIDERLRIIKMIIMSSTSTRKELSIVMKEEGDHAYYLYRQMWKNGLLRTGTLGWVFITKKGLKELERLEEEKRQWKKWKKENE